MMNFPSTLLLMYQLQLEKSLFNHFFADLPCSSPQTLPAIPPPRAVIRVYSEFT